MSLEIEGREIKFLSHIKYIPAKDTIFFLFLLIPGRGLAGHHKTQS